MEKKQASLINNSFYDDLDEMWNTSSDHPIALLRAENALRNPWVGDLIHKTYDYPTKVLDIGCGGGYLTNYLASKGHLVTGIDLSQGSLDVASRSDVTKSVTYLRGDAYELPFPERTFDVVCAMDILEHVEKPYLLIREASRVLNKGGLFFFHTFNRNLFSYLLVIKGVEWCFSNAPKNMHVYPLFIKPEELKGMCEKQRMEVVELKGVVPDMKQSSFWKSVAKRSVDQGFRFVFSPSLKGGYSGYARKLY